MDRSHRYINYPMQTQYGTQMPLGLLEDWNLINPYEPMYSPAHVPGYPGFAGDPVNLGVLDEPQPQEQEHPYDILGPAAQVAPVEPKAAPTTEKEREYLRLAGMVSQRGRNEAPPLPSLGGVGQGGRPFDITPYLRGLLARRGR